MATKQPCTNTIYFVFDRFYLIFVLLEDDKQEVELISRSWR